jgi:hypothetical protein
MKEIRSGPIPSPSLYINVLVRAPERTHSQTPGAPAERRVLFLRGFWRILLKFPSKGNPFTHNFTHILTEQQHSTNNKHEHR